MNGYLVIVQLVYVVQYVQLPVGSGGPAVERRTVSQGDGGSIPPTATLKL